MQLNKLKFTKLQVKEFADYYNSGHTIKEVANYFNIGYREALHYLIYFGYYTPKRKQNNICNYCINEDFFEIIDTQDKAYYLGFLMADGYVINTLYNKEIGMALQCCDKYILDKLNNYTSPDKLVIKYKNSYKWKVTSSKMFLDLNNYGITENKSHTLIRFPNIPEEFKRHFIRGFFDGDGCISIKSTGYNVISFCCCSKPFLEDIAYILSTLNISTRPIVTSIKGRKQPLYTLYLTGGNNKSKFKNYLYDNAETYLQRKFIKFMGIPC